MFEKKCPVCKTKLEKGKVHPEEFGKKFCSENCKGEYKKQMDESKSQNSNGGCCG